MFSKINSAALVAIDACIIQVEADINDGLPVFDMVGLLSSEVREARERVRVALRNSGYLLPPKRITVNLSPADIRKEGTAFDLPIAVAVLTAAGFLPQENVDSIVFIGELSLDGKIHPVDGVLSIVYEAEKNGFQVCMVPEENANEAAAMDHIKIIPAGNLRDAVDYILFPERFQPNKIAEPEAPKEEAGLDFSELIGQKTVKRAAEVAAAGHHNILMIGPPGAGKTMIAKRIPGILPELTKEESLEITKIYSVSGMLKNGAALMKKRPFRAPHHTATITALTGGGRNPKPGEISLASEGVLFLDELPEFGSGTIEVLRQPLEEKKITIDRIASKCTYPANFMLVAAMNPCRCGYYPDRSKCTCSPVQVRNYRGRISQPILDRIDICIEIYPVSFEEWFGQAEEERSEQIRERVRKARKIQEERYRNSGHTTNSGLNAAEIEQYCALGKAEADMMKYSFKKLGLSGRGYHRILKVARTIADLEGSKEIKEKHLREAICYRSIEVR